MVITFLATLGIAAAQFESELAPRELDGGREGKLPFGEREAREPAGLDQGKVLISRLQVIELMGRGLEPVFKVGGGPGGTVRGRGLTIESDELANLLLAYCGRPLSEAGLDRMIDTVLRFYEAHDRPVTEVVAPEQDLSGGVILLEIVEGRVGTVGLQGGGIFNDELLGGAVKLERGEPLLSSGLQSHLDWFNRNPFRPVEIFAAPGEEEGEADLVFAFSERRPWRVYLGYENSGAEVAGESRFLAGFNWGNAFGLDHSLNYQFTMGEALEELTAHAVIYEIPLHPWHHFIRLSGAFADLTSESVSAGVRVTSQGTSWLLGAAYGIQLPRWQDFKQEVSLGADFKSSDNFLVFGGVGAHPGSVVEIVQFRADYRATRRFEAGALEVRASLVGSPGGLSGNNGNGDFALFRAGADARYLYGWGEVTWTRRLPEGWTLRTRGQFQWASGSLLPIEQLALGGHDTVRGYEERRYLADHGYALSAEVRAPAINLPTGRVPAQLQVLGFVDHGMGWRDDTRAGEDPSDLFTSCGIGVRAQAGSYLQIRGDLGVPLQDGDGLRGHLGVIVSY